MLIQAIGNLLPAAAAVALSPIPIIAVVLVLSGPNARSDGPAFALGWIAGLAVVSVAVVLVAGGASDPNSTTASGVNWVTTGIGVLFLMMASRQWRKRPKHGETPPMPKWMGAVDAVPPGKAFLLGAGLSGANPKNLALTAAASGSIAQAGLGTTDTAIAILVFVVIGSITVAGAVAFYLVAPKVAQQPLASVKQFMSENNATIMMILLLILGLKFIGDGVGALGS